LIKESKEHEMGRRRLAGVALAAHLVSAVFGYGTTISIAVSYCPATYTSATTTSSTSSTPR
jgi:FlaG/FlaF family flagellin (archaellin)